ncbi:MAG: hypothetical protein LBB67_07560 [Oscillospiraceae bacterium]|jgi:hypothetical protein|nr:hypothetical protein [Oscillospiraceae bacterium]
MKKTSKRVLSLTLAILMIFGVSSAAEAAPFTVPAARLTSEQIIGTIEMITPPTAPVVTFDRYGWAMGYDLSGLVVRASGDALTVPVDVNYDEVMSDTYQETIADGKLNWYFILLSKEINWKVGENQAILYIYAQQYVNFTVEYTAEDGTEYGHYEQALVFFSTVDITIQGVKEDSSNSNFSSATELTLANSPVDVSIPKELPDEAYRSKFFKFSPAEDGYYIFESEGAIPSQSFYTREGEWLTLAGLETHITIYDENGYYISSDYGFWEEARVGVNLDAGTNYYIEAGAYPYGDYKLSVRKFDGQLKAKEYFTVYYHDYWDFASVLEGTTWNIDDLEFSYDSVTMQGYGEWMYGFQNGTGWLTIYAPDGETITVRYKVTYSPEQWLCVILLGGWYWMKWTTIGPFSLTENFMGMMYYYGIGNSLFDVFSDLGFPYWMISWLLALNI